MAETTVRRTRGAMSAETTAKLIAAARRSFATKGYADTSMDELCAEVGLTRGALYHHFGGKDGLLEAVVERLYAETQVRIEAAYAAEADSWTAFVACCRAYLRTALEPELQRIVLRDAPAALGQRFRDLDARSAIGPIAEALRELMASGRIVRCDPEALARLLNGALIDASLWIAASAEPEQALESALAAFAALVEGLAVRR